MMILCHAHSILRICAQHTVILYFCLQHTAAHKKTSLPLKNRAHLSALPGSPRSRALRRTTAAQPCSPRRRARAGLARHAAAARRGEERQRAGEPPRGGSSTAGAPACRSRTGVTAPSHRLDAPSPLLPEGAPPEAACRAATEGWRPCSSSPLPHMRRRCSGPQGRGRPARGGPPGRKVGGGTPGFGGDGAGEEGRGPWPPRRPPSSSSRAVRVRRPPRWRGRAPGGARRREQGRRRPCGERERRD